MIELERITAICKKFEKESYIGVSGHAQILMKDIFDAITIDPHPRWKVSKEELTSTVDTFVSDLPKFLDNVAKFESVEKIITSFDSPLQ
ncbi:MAG: hypothetical protein QME90_18760 [Thermodesulfobacteriota bacterium]|nr:hypothetical protein [Thermodesulfobacteriota bacterium]